jgi:hypothetical protein
MSHGETDTFEAYLKGEHFHVPHRVHVDVRKRLDFFLPQSATDITSRIH